MDTTLYGTENFPAWALCALVNGDTSGLDDSEIQQIENFERKYQERAKLAGYEHVIYSPADDEFFYAHPCFGLACNCVELEIVYAK